MAKILIKTCVIILHLWGTPAKQRSERRLSNSTMRGFNTVIYMEKHHMNPRSAGGEDIPENLIWVTLKEHFILHWVRWKVLGEKGDFLFLVWRTSISDDARERGRQAVKALREMDRIYGRNFFDSEVQRALGLRGGAIGGSRNTEAQFLARQRVGRQHGRNTGISNQGQKLKEQLQCFTIWAFNPAKNRSLCLNSVTCNSSQPRESFYLISPKKAFSDLCNVLTQFHPGSITNKATMHKVFLGERSQMYGWRLVKMIICSEIEKGYQEFLRDYPNEVLNVDDVSSQLEMD